MAKMVRILTLILILVNVATEALVEAREKAEPAAATDAGSGSLDELEEADDELVLPDEAELDDQVDAVALDQLELHLLNQKLKMLEQRAQVLRDSVMQDGLSAD